ncbi:C-type lectin domain family 17, member A-like [Cyprinodon tularosa]|uniref:C-type lectin domain family 17, member A-like n=1 Tax=Cyprinodon tularosa TaxID=77115 RepID=UPI0018E1EF12|nr:C-type lectin domain family 17, member A-like [Cyprinodon tularosa]
MQEEEVQYAAVTFKNKKKRKSISKNGEECAYAEVNVKNLNTQQTSDLKGCSSEKGAERKRLYCLILGCLFALLCIALMLGIIGFLFYQSKIKSLNMQQEERKNQTGKLEEQIKKLKEQMEKLEEIQNELNVSRAQWSINEYCLKKSNGGKCSPCQEGWNHFQTSCYAYNDADEKDRKNWTEARENCTGKVSDLTVVENEEEKEINNNFSPAIKGIKGYWIGLRADQGKWKWINGAELINTSWIKHNATDGQCVTVLKGDEWRSVSCDEKNAWICEKKALTIN